MSEIWTYYDAKGDRVGKRRAVFAGKEVVVATGRSARVGHAGIQGIEYRDVYRLTMPDDRRQFASKKRMLQWFDEAASSSGERR